MFKITLIDKQSETLELESLESPAELFAEVGRAGGWITAMERVDQGDGTFTRRMILVNGSLIVAVREGWDRTRGSFRNGTVIER
jgi:hypothetical protein